VTSASAQSPVEVLPNRSQPATPEEIERERVVMEVDLDAVADNAQLAIAAGDGQPIAVLKGDAYGMGLAAVGPLLRSAGIRRFATDNAAEAVGLREAGINDPVIVLYGEPGERIDTYIDHALAPVVYEEEQVARCVRVCADRDASLDVWIGANVGFNRAGGRSLSSFEELLEALRGADQRLRVVGVMAHLTASHLYSPRNEAEREDFRVRVAVARSRFGREIEASLLASHGLLRWGPRDETGPARPGLMLAGEHCFAPEVLAAEKGAAADLARRLRPAVSIRARIIHLLRTDADQTVGYAPGAEVPADRLLATVALGFRTGFPVSGQPPALYRGKLVPRVGPLGMDSLQVDVTSIPDAAVGDWVTLGGRDGEESLGLDRVWAAGGVSPYQLLSGLRVPRIYGSSTVHNEETDK
jgi:alanine racemase